MKLFTMFNIFKRSTNKTLDVVIVGYKAYYIIEIKNKDEVLLDKLISKLFTLYIPLYWVSSYNEFIDLFTYYKALSDIIFILIY